MSPALRQLKLNSTRYEAFHVRAVFSATQRELRLFRRGGAVFRTFQRGPFSRDQFLVKSGRDKRKPPWDAKERRGQSFDATRFAIACSRSEKTTHRAYRKKQRLSGSTAESSFTQLRFRAQLWLFCLWLCYKASIPEYLISMLFRIRANDRKSGAEKSRSKLR